MKLPDLDARFSAAKTMVLEAGEIAMASFRKPEMLGLRSKGLHDPVTEADLAIDHRLRQIIAEYFPEDGILSEEIGGSNARNLWVIDPIDGTQNFARGIGHFAISIAFLSVRADVKLVLSIILQRVKYSRRNAVVVHSAMTNVLQYANRQDQKTP